MSKSNNKNKGASSILIFAAIIVVAVFVLIGMNHKSTSTRIQSDAKQLTKKDCGLAGDPVIDIDQKVVNDADLVDGATYWANDNYDQHIKVWKQADNIYCAEINFTGNYDAQPGATSPGNKHIKLTGNEDGLLNGSSRFVIAGTLKTNPEWPTTGFVGITDFQCDLNGSCPDYTKKMWQTKYFENMQQNYPITEWYNWIYTNGDHVWINSSEGNSGEDIL